MVKMNCWAIATDLPRRASLAKLPLLPPRVKLGHRARLEREFGGALLEKRTDAFVSVRGAARPVDGLRVDAVRFHRMVGAEHLPQHLAGERDRHRGRVVGDLVG